MKDKESKEINAQIVSQDVLNVKVVINVQSVKQTLISDKTFSANVEMDISWMLIPASLVVEHVLHVQTQKNVCHVQLSSA